MEDILALMMLREILSQEDKTEDPVVCVDEEENVYKNRCNVIQSVLKKYGIESNVSRSHIGHQMFYNVDMNADTCDVPVNLFMRHLFDVDEIGLVSFYQDNVVVLIDEDALNQKYLTKNGFDFSSLDPNAMDTFNIGEALVRDLSLAK